MAGLVGGLIVSLVVAVGCIVDMRRFPSSAHEVSAAKRSVVIAVLLLAPLIGVLYYLLAVRPVLVSERDAGPTKFGLGGRVALTEHDPKAPAWLPDPSERHEARYWDGASWTSRVLDAGQETADPLGADWS